MHETNLSGTSGRQKQTHEWTSARLKWPINFSVFIGLRNESGMIARAPVNQLSYTIQTASAVFSLGKEQMSD